MPGQQLFPNRFDTASSVTHCSEQCSNRLGDRSVPGQGWVICMQTRRRRVHVFISLDADSLLPGPLALRIDRDLLRRQRGAIQRCRVSQSIPSLTSVQRGPY